MGLGSIFLFLSSLHTSTDYMRVQWFIGLALMIIGISYSIYRRYGIPWALATGYFFLNSLYLFAYPENRFNKSGTEVRALIAHYAEMQVICGFLALMFFLSLKERTFYGFKSAFALSGIANSVYVVIGCLFGFGRLSSNPGYSGIIDYAGLNGAFIVSLMPFVQDVREKWPRWVSLALCTIAVILSKSTIPVGMLVLYFLLSKEFSLKLKIGAIAVVTIGILASFGILEKRDFFSSAGRFEAYRIFMRFWWDRANMFTGFGPATFQTIAPDVQLAAKYMIEKDTNVIHLFLNLHSDFLQTLFENGIIGLSLLLALCAVILRRYLWNGDHTCFLSFFLIVSNAVFSAPTRYFPFCLLIIFLIVGALKLSDKSNVI